MTSSHRAYLLVLIIAVLCLSVWWLRDALIFVLIIALANVAGLFMLDRKDLIMVYLFLFIGAVMSEVALIYMGAWEYTQVHVLGFPVWMPFLWFSGVVFVGTMIALLRSGKLRASKSSH